MPTPETAALRRVASRSWDRLYSRLPLAARAVSLGVVGGLGTFMYTHGRLLPHGVSLWVPLALVAVTGAYAAVLSTTLTDRVSNAIFGSVVAYVVTVGAKTSALLAMSYPAGAGLLLFAKLAAKATTAYVLVYPLTFLGGFFALVVLEGLRE